MTWVLSSSSMCVGQVDPDHPLAVSNRDADITDTSLVTIVHLARVISTNYVFLTDAV